MMHVTSGEGGVWAVNRQYQIFYRFGKRRCHIETYIFVKSFVLNLIFKNMYSICTTPAA